MLKISEIAVVTGRLTLADGAPGLTLEQVQAHNEAVRQNASALAVAFCVGMPSFADASEMTIEQIRTLKDSRRVDQLAVLRDRCELGANIPQCSEGLELAQTQLQEFVFELLTT